jgi:hypothetical protein
MTDSGDSQAPGPESGDQVRWLADVIGTVRTPGAFLQWYGVASLLISVVFLIVYLVSPDTVFKPIYEWKLDQEKDPQERAAIGPYNKWLRQQVVPSVISSFVSLGCSFLIAFGGVKMRHLTGYGWAVAGSVLASVPCTNSCCCIGTPIGLWALVTLFGSDVRLGFARVGSAGGLESFEAEVQPRRDPPSSRPIRLE